MVDYEVLIRKGPSLVRLNLNDVIYIEAIKNQVLFNTCQGNFLIRLSISVIKEYLPGDIFLRIHPSYVVNAKMIRVMHEDSLDLMADGKLINLPTSYSAKNLLLERLPVTA